MKYLWIGKCKNDFWWPLWAFISTLVCLPPYFSLCEGNKWNETLGFLLFLIAESKQTSHTGAIFNFLLQMRTWSQKSLLMVTPLKNRNLRLKPNHFSYMLPMHIQNSSRAWNSFSLRSLLIPRMCQCHTLDIKCFI